MSCEVKSEVESLLYIDTVPHLQGCLEELATLEKCCNVVVHVIYTAITLLWPFASGSEQKLPSFEAFEQRHRIKKSQAQNCDTCSELK